MKTPDKRELHQIATNHSSDTEFDVFESFTAVPYSFLIALIPLFHQIIFYLLGKISSLFSLSSLCLTVCLSVSLFSLCLSLSLSHHHHHQAKLINMNNIFSDEEILPSNQSQIKQQAKFTYSALGKAFEKQTKTIKDQRDKQIDTIKFLENE